MPRRHLLRIRGRRRACGGDRRCCASFAWPGRARGLRRAAGAALRVCRRGRRRHDRGRQRGSGAGITLTRSTRRSSIEPGGHRARHGAAVPRPGAGSPHATEACIERADRGAGGSRLQRSAPLGRPRPSGPGCRARSTAAVGQGLRASPCCSPRPSRTGTEGRSSPGSTSWLQGRQPERDSTRCAASCATSPRRTSSDDTTGGAPSPAALERAGATAASHGLDVRVRVHGDPVAVPADVASALVRSTRGALANVVEHAHATRAAHQPDLPLRRGAARRAGRRPRLRPDATQPTGRAGGPRARAGRHTPSGR